MCSCAGHRTVAQEKALREAGVASQEMLQCVADNDKAVALKHLLEAFG